MAKRVKRRVKLTYGDGAYEMFYGGSAPGVGVPPPPGHNKWMATLWNPEYDAALLEVVESYGWYFLPSFYVHPVLKKLLVGHRETGCQSDGVFCFTGSARARLQELDIEPVHIMGLLVCPICQMKFLPGDVHISGVRLFGPMRYCSECCSRAVQVKPNGAEVAVRYLRAYAEKTRELPHPSKLMRAGFFRADLLSVQERDAAFQLFIEGYSVDNIYQSFGSWTQALHAAGLLGQRG